MAMTQRRKRRTGVGRFKIHQAPWVDPFPHIPGTEPEKRIFAALYDQKYFFIFQGQVSELEKEGKWGVSAAIPGYKPDFVLPEYKVIIDPFSPFHHSLKEAIERDARKIGLYTALGYKYYHPWALANGVFLADQEIWGRKKKWKWSEKYDMKFPYWKPIDVGDLRGFRGTANDVISWIPELRGRPRDNLTKREKKLKENPGYELGEFLGAGANSVAAANMRRRKPKPVTIKTGTRRWKRGENLKAPKKWI